MQERALARPGWRDDGNHLSLPQTQAGIRQNHQTFLAAAVDFLQASRFHDQESGLARSLELPGSCCLVAGSFCSRAGSLGAKKYQAASLYLDATQAARVFLGRGL